MTINSLRHHFSKISAFRTIPIILLLCLSTTMLLAQKLPIDTINKTSITSPTLGINTDSLLHFAEKYLGTPYKIAGKSAKGFDCSGFVHHVYKEFNVKVPFSCPAISSACPIKLDKSEVQKGDLLFFKGSNSKSKSIGHIAIVHTVDESGIRMIHSCRRGVILESLNDSKYYKARYLFAKRIL